MVSGGEFVSAEFASFWTESSTSWQIFAMNMLTRGARARREAPEPTGANEKSKLREDFFTLDLVAQQSAKG